MIFGEGYDTSLWLMLYSDNQKRNMILDFIKSIPEDLFIKIYSAIDIVNEYKGTNVSLTLVENKGLHSNIETSDRLLYWFRIDPYNRGMTLGYSIFDGEKYDKTFEIILYPFDETKMKQNECIVVGDIKYDILNSTCNNQERSKIKYELKKGMFGWKLMCTSNQRKNNKQVIVPNIPSMISISDIKNPKSLNRLVRRKNNHR